MCQTPLNTMKDIFKWWSRIAASVLRAVSEWGLREWRGHALTSLRSQCVVPVPHLYLIWNGPKLWNFWNATWLFTVSRGAFFFFCSHVLMLLEDTGKGVRIWSKHSRISGACGDSAPFWVTFIKDSRMWDVPVHTAPELPPTISACAVLITALPSFFYWALSFSRAVSGDAPAHHINKNIFCGSNSHCSCG